jgi:hypothetical protein
MRWRSFGNIMLAQGKPREVGVIPMPADSLAPVDFKPMVVSLGELTEMLPQATAGRRAHGRTERASRRKSN